MPCLDRRRSCSKKKAGEATCRRSAIANARATKLETKLQECMADQDTLQFRLGEASQSSSRIMDIHFLGFRICWVLHL
jgi:hypothetical protein